MNPFQQAFTFLENHHLGVLSTVTIDNTTWGSAVYFVVDEHLNFYFLTHTGTEKYKNMTIHPQVAITVVDDEQQTTIQASGIIGEVPIGDENTMAYGKLAAIHPPHEASWTPPLSKTENGKIILMKLSTDTMQFSNYHTKPIQIEKVI